MIELDDPIWKTLNGGYRVPYDASVRLRELKAGVSDREEIWDELFDELHHQRDVDLASYAAVPHLVKICAEQQILEWELFTLVATIEECRIFGENPELPDSMAGDYHSAIKALAAYGASKCSGNWPEELTQSYLAVTAFAAGLVNAGRFLTVFSDDMLAEVTDKIFL